MFICSEMMKKVTVLSMMRKGGKPRYSPLEAQTRRTQRQWVRFRWWPRFCLVKLRITSVASAFCTFSPNFLSVKSIAGSKLLWRAGLCSSAFKHTWTTLKLGSHNKVIQMNWCYLKIALKTEKKNCIYSQLPYTKRNYILRFHVGFFLSARRPT